MEKLEDSPVETWTQSIVSSWLRLMGINESYIEKLHEEEVDGRVLCELTEEFLKKETGMKSGPALLIIKRRDQLVKSQKSQKQQRNKQGSKQNDQRVTAKSSNNKRADIKEDNKEDSVTTSKTKRDSKPRPFGKEGVDFTYVRHDVLLPESGVVDLINPCHEYKSLATAATLDRQRLQAKFAKEVLKFATGCMNIRTNGTIHFGVMDSRDDTGYVHGEIIGVPVKEKDIYVDALDYIERSFSSSDRELVRQCIHPPQFIQVVRSNTNENHYVVEVDIEPSVSLVKNKVFSVRLPNFKEQSNKVEFEKENVYCRVGSKTEPVIEPVELNRFYQQVNVRDAQREEAETKHSCTALELCQDLGKKLTMLITGGKKIMDKDKWYILISNKFQEKDLKCIDFLLNMNIFCVFDFDQDSMVSGLCQEYKKHHAVKLHFMQNYRIPSGKNISEFESDLHLFDQVSWIFCNGRSDFKGNEPFCDEKTWVKTKRTLLKDCVSLICKDILPNGTFQVIFLLTSPVDTPFLNTFYEFFTDMEGHEDIICLAESEDNFKKWQDFALGSCDMETVKNFSVVGMTIGHINATLQRIQPVTTRTTKRLPIFVKGECSLDTREEEMRCSLEILSVNHCEETNPEFIKSEKEDIERQFYHGGKVTWMNLWMAEKNIVGEIIYRDAYCDVNKFVKDSPKWSLDQTAISCINIYHHPGSGGSTVAKQVLWNNRKDLRCAVVKPSYSASEVSEHAVWLREYEEKDPKRCLPVLLLFEDCDQEYLDDVKNELEVAVNTKKITRGTLCFILLCCRRSHNPEKKCKEAPLENVAITHKLSEKEKKLFSAKRKTLEKQFHPEFILTFVLMSEEFKDKKIAEYVKQFVTHLLQDIDHTSVVTKLVRYVALLNTYVQNSFISRSHCEALLTLSIHVDRFRQHNFETSLSDQAKLVLIHLRDEKSHIECIRIIHPLVAKEILHQLLGDKQQQSDLALDLLKNNLLFEHRFGKDEYLKFLRDLFMRRCKISRGDESDSFFSPLIEHVRENECPAKAIELLKEAYIKFEKDALFAQQLARLSYRYEQFEYAEHWAEIAAKKMPNNSYILDTKGQVYRWWFTAKCKAMERIKKTPENTADAVGTALKAIECFQACEKAAHAEHEIMNNSGFFGAVEVGCSLLKLISSLSEFSRDQYLKYLLTDYIPDRLEKPWEHFHTMLKNLKDVMQEALEWISEDLSYFQTDVNDEGDTTETCELTVKNPKKWLGTKYNVYVKYFSDASPSTLSKNPDSLTPLQKSMMICCYGGGNITTIFSLLTEKKDKDHVRDLETIISLYPSNPMQANMDQKHLVNYIASHLALSCLSIESSKLAAFQHLQKLSQRFPKDKHKCLASALFLLVLLFWPEEQDTEQEKERKYETVLSAVEHLKEKYFRKLKDIPQRKKRIYTHFFLSGGTGLKKFVHKSKVEKITKLLSVSEKRQKWLHGEVWKMPEISELLKCVTGWTEDGTVYLEGPKTKKFHIPPLNNRSVPYGNENVSFYLGFTMRGPVAYNITVKP